MAVAVLADLAVVVLRVAADGKLRIGCVCWRWRGCSQAVCLNLGSLSAR